MFTGKGGLVKKQYIADLEIMDERFSGCISKASYSIFKEGKPEKVRIKLEELTIPIDDQLELYLNDKNLAKIQVNKNKKAKYRIWSDEDSQFPEINAGDELTVKYEGKEVLKGFFELDS